MAIVLMRKTGFAWSSNPYGITDPKGNPCCLRESVERLPTRPRYTKVRARSANVGSATAGWLLAAPEPVCFPVVNEDIPVLPHGFGTGSGVLLCPGSLEQANTSRLALSVQRERTEYASCGVEVWRGGLVGDYSGVGRGNLWNREKISLY